MVPTGACVVVIVIAPLVRQRSWVLPVPPWWCLCRLSASGFLVPPCVPQC